MTEPKRRIGRSTVPATIAWCAARGHPVTTYNPWGDLSLCRCGKIQIDGDAPMTEAGWRALHEEHHACEYGSGPCGCYTRQHAASIAARGTQSSGKPSGRLPGTA